jgi:PAS domain S-box-containing protein
MIGERPTMRLDGTEQTRLRAHAIALALAAAATLLRILIGPAGPAGTFLLDGLAIAIATAHGGFAPGVVAALAATLLARVTTGVGLWAALAFTAEGTLLALLVARLCAALDERSERLAAAEGRIRELKAIENDLRAADAAFEALEGLPGDCAAVLLDLRSRISGWRGGASRLFGWTADQMMGERASTLFADPDGEAVYTRLLGAVTDGCGRSTIRQRRADGGEFDADVELRELPGHGCHRFAMLVHDRSREQAWSAFAESSAEVQAALRDEADVAHRQLATLQHVTDPAVNALSASQAASALLERLRAAIDADGAALVRVGPFRRRLVSVNERLEAQGGVDRRQNDARAPQDDRILVIQNDPARVAALSLVNWPDTVSSLIAVPILAGGVVEGAIEVVGLRSRRSTEWEIALVQVVAARIAGRLQDESYLDADAVA